MTRLAQILLVEDNPMDIELTLDAFKQARLLNAVHIASDGKEALDYLFGRGKFADRKEFPMPNLVLLDLKLPGIDGIEVLRQIKSTPGLKRLPVVILTSSREEGDLALSYDSGANSFLVKPVSFEGFLDVVRQIEGYWISLNIAPPENST
jgi:CheY-like chemotaxis protein